MSPETGSLLILLLFCAGATAVNLTTAHPNADKALAVKPGTCPAPSCGISPFSLKPLCVSDGDCPGKKKCCTPKCRRECTDPMPSVKPGTCPAPSTFCAISPSSPRPKPLCTSDGDCPGKKKCCTPKCRQECIDPLPPVKPGTCPVPSTFCADSPSSPRPKPRCTSDGDCPGKKKCCTPKCGQECIDPLPPVKSGTCPASDTICDISPSSPRPKPLCTSDGDCLGKKKCCTTKCRQECIDPLPLIKSGQCPYFKDNELVKCDTDKTICDTDEDCGGLQKCCPERCKNQCRDPVVVAGR